MIPKRKIILIGVLCNLLVIAVVLLLVWIRPEWKVILLNITWMLLVLEIVVYTNYFTRERKFKDLYRAAFPDCDSDPSFRQLWSALPDSGIPPTFSRRYGDTSITYTLLSRKIYIRFIRRFWIGRRLFVHLHFTAALPVDTPEKAYRQAERILKAVKARWIDPIKGAETSWEHHWNVALLYHYAIPLGRIDGSVLRQIDAELKTLLTSAPFVDNWRYVKESYADGEWWCCEYLGLYQRRSVYYQKDEGYTISSGEEICDEGLDYIGLAVTMITKDEFESIYRQASAALQS
ncbi:hypothetical protein SAMN05216383_103173 [Prevotella sp. KH2C16]|nr:hypothetical protein SAMN05216383_103173 [Prevotella sp. KH2C16]